MQKSKEVWLPVKNYEGHYEVSNLGEVKSLKNGRCLILSQSLTGKMYKKGGGYYSVKITLNGKSKLVAVHILVASSFLNHETDGTNNLVIDHINNISTDNRVSNLAIITNRENCSKGKALLKKSSSFTGVCWNKRRSKWAAYIDYNNKRYHLGVFDNEVDASEKYKSALQLIINKEDHNE